MSTLGRRVKDRRKELGIGRDELAKFSGMSYSALADIENDRQHSTTRLHKLAERLGVRASWLETGEGPRDVPQGPLSPSPVDNVAVHGFLISRDAAELGSEWEKIAASACRDAIRNLIMVLVGDQKRSKRKPNQPRDRRVRSVS